MRPRTPGIDYHQAVARDAADMEMPRITAPKVTPKLVGCIITAECPACGCTNAWPIDQKAKTCAYCNARHKPITHYPPRPVL